MEYGDRTSLWHMIGTSLGLIAATLAPVWFDVGGPLYAVTASVLAAVALVGSVWGIRVQAGPMWARATHTARRPTCFQRGNTLHRGPPGPGTQALSSSSAQRAYNRSTSVWAACRSA